jgi:CBS domain-containing protein
MKVRELMVRDVVTVSPEEHLGHAARLMREHGCGCLPVVDHERRAVAMLTDRDICMAACSSDSPLSALHVKDAMSRTLITCQANESVAEAEHSMGLQQVRRLPVVGRGGRLEGLLTLDDIAAEARREIGLIAPPVAAAAVGQTLGEIGRPRIICGIEHA